MTPSRARRVPSDNVRNSMEDSIYRLRHRDVLTLCVLSLLFLGVVMVQSAAMNVTGDAKWQWTERGMKHLVYAMVAIVTFFAVGNLDYAWFARGKTMLRSPALWAFAVALFACTIALIPHVGIEVNGARRWLWLGCVQVPPSERAKWAIVVRLAWWLTPPPVNLGKFFTGFVPTGVPIGAMCLLVVIQDFGTAAVIGLCA